MLFVSISRKNQIDVEHDSSRCGCIFRRGLMTEVHGAVVTRLWRTDDGSVTDLGGGGVPHPASVAVYELCWITDSGEYANALREG